MLGIAGKVEGPTRESLYANGSGAVHSRQTPHGAAMIEGGFKQRIRRFPFPDPLSTAITGNFPIE